MEPVVQYIMTFVKRSSRLNFLCQKQQKLISYNQERLFQLQKNLVCTTNVKKRGKLIPLQPTVLQISVFHVSPGGELLQDVGRQAYRGVIHSTP